MIPRGITDAYDARGRLEDCDRLGEGSRHEKEESHRPGTGCQAAARFALADGPPDEAYGADAVRRAPFRSMAGPRDEDASGGNRAQQRRGRDGLAMERDPSSRTVPGRREEGISTIARVERNAKVDSSSTSVSISPLISDDPERSTLQGFPNERIETGSLDPIPARERLTGPECVRPRVWRHGDMMTATNSVIAASSAKP